MARRKIINDTILTLGDDIDKLIVQKSRPLISLGQADFSLPEYKILDTYLGRINSHDPRRRTVILEKGELEKLLEVQKINSTQLEERLANLMRNVVKVVDKKQKKGFKLITLFEEATAELQEDGLWRIKLTCTAKAKKYIFNIDNVGYLRYNIRCITALRSRYSYLLFIYLEYNRYRKKWTEDIDELKKILRCTKETYNEYKHFNNLVIKKAQDELEEKTQCLFKYKPIKTGRKVSKIEFEILNNIDERVEQLKKELCISELDQQNPSNVWGIDNGSDEEAACVSMLVNSWKETLKYLMFTEKKINAIEKKLYSLPDDVLPVDNDTNSIDIRRYHYMSNKVSLMMALDEEKKIKNKFAYLIAMMDKDNQEAIEKTQEQEFEVN